MNIFDHYRQRYEAAKDEEFTLQEFLTTCRQDRSAYANAAERLLMAIGEPVMVDTAQEPRLSRLFSNRVIARYPAFEEFYGMEDAIEQIVSYLKHAAQGLEEKKQILNFSLFIARQLYLEKSIIHMRGKEIEERNWTLMICLFSAMTCS